MQEVAFRSGDVLFQEGERGDAAYLLESGTVEILRGYPAQPRPVGKVGEGEVFGEMGLIDERPRGGTARAATDGRATKLSRDEFSQLLVSDPPRCLPFLRSLFERLRQLEERTLAATDPTGPGEGRKSGQHHLTLHPLSRHTASILDEKGFVIETFPFRLGRASEAREREAIDLNDLWLLDKPPFTISRNHATFELAGGTRYFIRDRGSHLGTTVNEKQIGGKSSLKEADLEEGDNVVILGGRSSPFQFRVVLERIAP